MNFLCFCGTYFLGGQSHCETTHHMVGVEHSLLWPIFALLVSSTSGQKGLVPCLQVVVFGENSSIREERGGFTSTRNTGRDKEEGSLAPEIPEETLKSTRMRKRMELRPCSSKKHGPSLS